MPPVWVIVLGSVAVLVALFVVVLRVAGRKIMALRGHARARVEQEILKGRPARRMDDFAQSLGVTSRGVVQLRGNGCLVLTDDALVFLQWVPERVETIALSDIVGVEEVSSHLGKWVGTPLLLVRFRAGAQEDSIGLRVRDLAGWIAELRPHAAERPASAAQT